MASTRLTSTIRERILQDVLEHAYGDRCRKLFAAELALTEDVYTAYIAQKVRFGSRDIKLSIVLNDMPRGWCTLDHRMKVKLGDDIFCLSFQNGLQDNYNDNVSLLVGLQQATKEVQDANRAFPPYSAPYSHVLMQFDHDAELSRRFRELRSLRAELVQDIKGARISAQSALDNATTVQRLIQGWPEIESFARVYLSEESAAKAILPTVARDKLNDMLGLPPGVAA